MHEEGSALELSTLVQAIATLTTMEFGVAVRCVVEGEASGVPGALSRELLMVVREAFYNSVLHENAEQEPPGLPQKWLAMHLHVSLHHPCRIAYVKRLHLEAIVARREVCIRGGQIGTRIHPAFIKPLQPVLVTDSSLRLYERGA
jgi:hypothetical protein